MRTHEDGPLDDREIAAQVRRLIEGGLNREDGDLSNERIKILDRYKGEKAGTGVRDGYSKYCTREVYEFVEWSVPAIISVFQNPGRPPLKYKYYSAEDAALARQERDVVGHFMFERGSSSIDFEHGIRAAVMFPAGFWRVYAEPKTRPVPHHYKGLNEIEAMEILSDEGIDIIKAYEHVDPATGQATYELKFIELPNPDSDEYDVGFRYVNPEDVWVSPELDKPDLDHASWVCHRQVFTHSELVRDFGYSSDDLEEAGGAMEANDYKTEKSARMDREKERVSLYNAQETTLAGKRYEVLEWFGWMDQTGSGVQKYYRIVVIGQSVFENEEIDPRKMPLVTVVAMLEPGKAFGRAPADIAKTDQELMTALVRQTLDNAYRANRGRTMINKRILKAEGKAQYLNTASELVEVDGPVTGNVQQETPTMVIQQLLPLLQWGQDAKKVHTGIAPENSMNPDVLRDAAAHNMLMSQDTSSKRLMHMIRIIGETGVKRLAEKIHAFLRTYQDKEMILELRGDIVQADPRLWREDREVQVQVGLGFNNDQRQLMALKELLMLQAGQMVPQGGAQYKHVHNTLRKVVELAQLGHVDEFAVKPEDYKPPQPPPDPKTEIEKLKLQLDEKVRSGELTLAQRAQALDEFRVVRAHELEDRKTKMALEEQLANVTKTIAETHKIEAETDKVGDEQQNLRAERAAIAREVRKSSEKPAAKEE